MARSTDAGDQACLIRLLPALQFEVAFRAVEDEAPSYAEESLKFSPGLSHVTASYGAITCLEACLRLLEGDGFVLACDYGHVRPDKCAAFPARHGASLQIGVNFPFIENHFERAGYAVVKPSHDAGQDPHARLLYRGQRPRLLAALDQAWTDGDWERADELAVEARQHAEAGRRYEALLAYQAALARAPRDWYLLLEATEFMRFGLRDLQTAQQLLRRALAVNPYTSPDVWVEQGNCLFALGQFAEAREAYLRARRIDPRHARATCGLARCHQQAGAHAEALAEIARALALDHNGIYREGLLTRQQQVLAALSQSCRVGHEQLSKRNRAYQLITTEDLQAEKPPAHGPPQQQRA